MVYIAQYGLIIILSILLIFHFLILIQLIPFRSVWGGRLKSYKEMVRLETLSIFANFFFLFVILVQSQTIKIEFPTITLPILLWVMTTLFFFNTFGNILSKNQLERRLFAPITIILAFFSFILALTY